MVISRLNFEDRRLKIEKTFWKLLEFRVLSQKTFKKIPTEKSARYEKAMSFFEPLEKNWLISQDKFTGYKLSVKNLFAFNQFHAERKLVIRLKMPEISNEFMKFYELKRTSSGKKSQKSINRNQLINLTCLVPYKKDARQKTLALPAQQNFLLHFS